jgi:hypothetical protein
MWSPNTSIPYTESVFSIGGDIITKKGNKLGVDNTRRLLCLQDWGMLVEEEEVDNNSNQEDEDRADSWELHHFLYIVY